jgi:hypothetical protein
MVSVASAGYISVDMILLCKPCLKGANVVKTHKNGPKTAYTTLLTPHIFYFISSYVASKIRNQTMHFK